MTMLDRMRRHKTWLKWSLAVVVIAFVAVYIPSFLKSPSLDGASNYGVVASVDGRDITVGRFRRVYQQQMQAYRNAYGGNMDEKLLKQLGIDQRIVQQLIEIATRAFAGDEFAFLDQCRELHREELAEHLGGDALFHRQHARLVMVAGDQAPQRAVVDDRDRHRGADAHVAQIFAMDRRHAAQMGEGQVERLAGVVDRRFDGDAIVG